MKVETKVGLLFLMAVIFIVIFASMMGMMNPFTTSNELIVYYNYAGGIDKGSPVRVMGIEVGKVKSIEFDPNGKFTTGEEVKLKIKIGISKAAWTTVRQDSRFYINMAGVIGEKFLEISPGTTSTPIFEPGALVRGEDPPRIDQMISQGYGLAGKILDVVSRNEGSVTGIISQMDQLLVNFNKTLLLLDKTSQNKDIAKLMSNFIILTDDLVYFTKKLRSEKSDHAFDTILKLLNRLDELDGPVIRKFLQEEGIKAKLF